MSLYFILTFLLYLQNIQYSPYVSQEILFYVIDNNLT